VIKQPVYMGAFLPVTAYLSLQVAMLALMEVWRCKQACNEGLR